MNDKINEKIKDILEHSGTEPVMEHAGTKGMRWGVRRYQNPDGTLTPEGKKRYSQSTVTDEVKKITDSGSNITRTISGSSKPSKKAMAEMQKMSDKELQARVNRLNNEKKYAELNPSAVSRGANKVGSILSVAGSLAAIGASVATIALIRRELKNT